MHWEEKWTSRHSKRTYRRKTAIWRTGAMNDKAKNNKGCWTLVEVGRESGTDYFPESPDENKIHYAKTLILGTYPPAVWESLLFNHPHCGSMVSLRNSTGDGLITVICLKALRLMSIVTAWKPSEISSKWRSILWYFFHGHATITTM